MSNHLLRIYQKGHWLCALKQFKFSGFPLEITMAKVNISRMDVQSLMDLRKRVDERLLECRAQMASRQRLA